MIDTWRGIQVIYVAVMRIRIHILYCIHFTGAKNYLTITVLSSHKNLLHTELKNGLNKYRRVVLPEPVLFCLNILNVYVSYVCHNNLLREMLQTEGFMQKECSLLYV